MDLHDIEWIKDKGNKAFRAGDLVTAIVEYNKGLKMLGEPKSKEAKVLYCFM